MSLADWSIIAEIISAISRSFQNKGRPIWPPFAFGSKFVQIVNPASAP
jgi:hypothetical protein